MAEPQTAIEPHRTRVAYFCMEVGLGEPHLPTYAGGLGVLAGDTLRSAADLSVPMLGVTLLHRQGYFRQHLDAQGNQHETPEAWRPELFLELTLPSVLVQVEGRWVQLRAWRLLLHGAGGGAVPVYFLDADLAENDPQDRALTGQLYGGDARYRLRQEALLGLGGVAMLAALGHRGVRVFHMNEGHSALLGLALLEASAPDPRAASEERIEAVRSMCVFTTHTPVPAAMDRYAWPLVERVIGAGRAALLEAAGCRQDNQLNMTLMALRFSRYVNGVAMRHGEVSRGMFPRYPINSITNGVHAPTWASPPFARLYDRFVPEWRRDNHYLRYAISVPLAEIRQAHEQAKRRLLERVRPVNVGAWSGSAMTLGFARRATPYKRAGLLFRDPERLRAIARRFGGLQVVMGGKAHPADSGGKEIIREVFRAAAALEGAVSVSYLENYDIEAARDLVAGVDLWLNTPLRPNEASGTSGMKAALNGVPSLSILDGWWVEGCVEGVTGWAIGNGREAPGESDQEALALYDKLEREVLPLFHGRPEGYAGVMRSCVALNGAYFNAQRMLAQYLVNAYGFAQPHPHAPPPVATAAAGPP